jgi:hypothetical protein
MFDSQENYGFFCDMEHGYSYNINNESNIKTRVNKQTRNIKFTKISLVDYINEDNHVNKELYDTDFACDTYNCLICNYDTDTENSDKYDDKLNRELSRRLISVSIILGLSVSIIACLM